MKLGTAGPQDRETAGFPDDAALFGMSGTGGFEGTIHPLCGKGSAGACVLMWGSRGANRVYPRLVMLAGE
ncbi:hypothetical protein Slala03_30750 [Streptomyces lavendulae subsp. lavendulae]|nr:hypothetical protein Slala03_30750 [Streptomyces lavendulae subsp. lavendulae]